MRGWHFRTCSRCGDYFYTRARYCRPPVCKVCAVDKSVSKSIGVLEYEALKKRLKG